MRTYDSCLLAVTMLLVASGLEVRGDDGIDPRKLIASGVSARQHADFTGAEKCFKSALDRAEAAHDSPAIAQATLEFGHLRHDQFKLTEAVTLYENGLELTLRTSGGRSAAYAVALHNLGQLYSDAGEYQKARAKLETALSLMKSIGDNRQACMMSSTLGILARREGRLDDALRYYASVLDSIESKQVNDPLLKVNLCLNLGVTFTEQKNLNAADAVLGKAIAFLNQTAESDGVPAAACYTALARLRWKQSKMEEARVYAAKAIQICERGLGKDHPHTATALQASAEVMIQDGSAEEGRRLLDRVLEIRRQKLGADHPLLAEALAWRAKAERVQSRSDTALSSYAQAYTLLTKRYAEKFPPSLKWVAEDYSAVLREQGKVDEAAKIVNTVGGARPR